MARPRKVVKAAADALDERAAQAAPELFDLAFEQARGGSTAAVKMLLEHVWLVGRDRPLKIAVPGKGPVAKIQDVCAVRCTRRVEPV